MTRVEVDRDSVNDLFVVVSRIYKKNGDVVAAGEPVLDIETSKTTREILSPEGGALSLQLSVGDEVATGALLFEVNAPRSHAQVADSTLATPDPSPAGKAVGSRGDTGIETGTEAGVVAGEVAGRELSRAAAHMARRLGVAQRALPSGWVTASDVLAAAALDATPGVSNGAAEAGPGAEPRARFREQRIAVPKRTEARVLTRANSSGTTSVIGIDVQLPGPRLVPPIFLFQDSITDLVVFETARLVRRFPELNAFYKDERTVGYYEQVNVGISFDAGRNLKVLALANADTLSVAQTQTGIEHLLELYESDVPVDAALLSTSTFTVSDLSRSAAGYMLPLLNSDQSLIIGITRRNPRLYSLHAAFDHRVSEGLQVATMLGELRDRLASHHGDEASSGADMSALRCSLCDQSMQVEVSRNGRGMVKVLLPDGLDGLLCWNCFTGW